VQAPSLETARLVLRGHRLDDFEPSAAMWADEAVVRHISGRPSTRDQSWSRVLRYAGHWALLGYGLWVIRERASGRFVGEAGFADYHREIEPSLDGIPELGWVFVRDAWGNGYATEAVEGALAWGREHLRAYARTACIIAPENVASIRVAEKTGFCRIAETTYLGEPCLLFDRSLRPEGAP
jgi:RimJ/RimL family protein N-acetyltransferase